MSRNAFSPPVAPVADFESPALEIPAEVLRACTLVWLAFLVSLLDPIIVIVESRRNPVNLGLLLLSQSVACAVGLALTLWIIAKLRRGRNWMRLLVTILFGASMLWIFASLLFFKGQAAHMLEPYTHNPLKALTMLARYGLAIWYIVLLNLPASRAWFEWQKTNRE